MPEIIAIANQKGGVGKTTTTVNLAAGLHEIGKKTLLVDLDTQGNATTACGIDKNNTKATVYDLFLTKPQWKKLWSTRKQMAFGFCPPTKT